MDKLHIKKQTRIIIASIAFIALFISCISNNAKSETDLEKDGYHGNIQEVIEYDCKISFGTLHKEAVRQSITYNKDGYRTEAEDGNKTKYKFKYDSNNNKTESCVYNSDGSLDGKAIFKYDSNNNKTEYCWYDSDGNLYWKYTYKYDSNNNEIEWCEYSPEGSLNRKEIKKYDSNNNLIEEYWYGSDGCRRSKYTYKYDSNNNRIEEYYLSGEGEVLTGGKIIEYKYW